MANKIKYGDRELDMGDLTLEQAKQLMARHFPELADPQVDKKENKNDTIYTFTKKAGRKGYSGRTVAVRAAHDAGAV
jgi:PRTRC genetic system protein C